MPERIRASQSPENGSQHCKTTSGSFNVPTRKASCRNPLKTGLSTARRIRRHPRSGPGRGSASQSPENGSQHCKEMKAKEAIRELRERASQSPENGSQHCKRSRWGVLRGFGGSLPIAIP